MFRSGNCLALLHGYTELALSLIECGASVNQSNRYAGPPLHIALTDGYTEVAHSLIKHGASVSQGNRCGVLPFTCYFNKAKDAKHLNDAIFTKLVPDSNMDIVKAICQILNQSIRNRGNTGKEQKLEVLSSMLHKLIQYLILVEPLTITIQKNRNRIRTFEMKLNPYVITNRASLKTVYLCSVLLILLGCDVSFVDAIAPQLSSQLSSIGTSARRAKYLLQASAVDDLWNAYKQKTGVRKLQALCIQKTRQSMHSLIDESFQSLPVPPHLQKMLMLEDIADVVFEGYKMWPKCMPIEEPM